MCTQCAYKLRVPDPHLISDKELIDHAAIHVKSLQALRSKIDFNTLNLYGFMHKKKFFN